MRFLPTRFLITTAFAVSSLYVISAHADMSLNATESSVSLVSTKVLADGSTSVSERFRFNEVAGQIDEQGNAVVSIDLASIETGIDIRNQRMIEFLFEAADFPNAEIAAMIPADIMNEGTTNTEITATVTLHGTSSEVSVPVAVHHSSDNVYVNAVEPVLFDTNTHDFGAGLGKLAELAGLLHIPTTVPVSFSLSFSK